MSGTCIGNDRDRGAGNFSQPFYLADLVHADLDDRKLMLLPEFQQ